MYIEYIRWLGAYVCTIHGLVFEKSKKQKTKKQRISVFYLYL